MKNLLKLFTLIILFFMVTTPTFAIQTNKIDKLIKNSPLYESSTIAISIKNASNNNVIYELNQKKLLHPASTLKLFTTYAALDTLGYEYQFKTGFYKDSQNNLYIKLGADPLLTNQELRNALETIKSKGFNCFANLYIDDSIIDKKEFAQGWMWDDDVNPYTPKVSAYNLDSNTVKVNMFKNSQGLAELQPKTSYPMSIYSYIKTDSKDNYLDIERYNWNNPELLEVYGTVKNPVPFSVPISSMRRYFIHYIEKYLEDSKIQITSTLFASKMVPSNAELLTEIQHPISNTIPLILQNSNNLMAETIFKLAAAQKYAATGSEILAEKLFKEFYQTIGIDTSGILVKDGCGVSRNNLIYTDWMTTTLNKLYESKDFETYRDNMAQPGDGTLSNRLFDLRGDAWLKTGSLSNISAIAGYVKSLDGNTYSVAILIQNYNDKPLNVKKFENDIITLIYNH